MTDAAQLAALAEVAEPPAGSIGHYYLVDVHDHVRADLTAIGPGLHVTCLLGAAEDAVPESAADVFSACLDLGLLSAAELEGAGRRLAAAVLAAGAAVQL